ncbi:AbrB family transcriptional regulator [Sphingomonas naphthae]|uniref:AbrB family transcriptional regulator n=1 Tax=Sphingomonas naphthae TaxID=1813468 RepID=A0ABY7TNW6_9SPHN|nr:AbrB family transcriptional regulator [Sphingomonas naphthae]WCT74758.1 AbrB family transcriptional regulator [Sphingomonas naphthae]
MTDATPTRLAALGRWQWPPLIVAAVVMSWLFGLAGINAAMFLAPMVAGLIFAFSGSDLKMPRQATIASQGVIGVIVARSLEADVLAFVASHPFPVAFVIVATAAASCLVAWGLFRFSPLDDETAAWGSMPGAANIMVAFAAEYGGDTRLVALMQYLRLILVVGSASLVASLLTSMMPHGPIDPAVGALKAAAPSDAQIGWTILLAIVGVIAGKLSRIPAGPLLVTALLGAVLHLNGILDPVLPHWMLAVSYGLIGLYVGLQFNRAIMLVAVRSLPAMAIAIVVLILLSSLVGIAFAWMLNLDLVTGYLATSPGAIDSIAILALGSNATMSVVMAVQAIRFFAVILMAPYLVKLIHLGRKWKPA